MCDAGNNEGLEFSIVICVDGEEKQLCAKCPSKPCSKPATPTSCSKPATPCSKPTTPTCNRCGGKSSSCCPPPPCCCPPPPPPCCCPPPPPPCCCPPPPPPCCCPPPPPPCCCSKPATPCCSNQSCGGNKVVLPICIGKPVCQPSACQSQPCINPPKIIPTGPCCCASLLSATCQQHSAVASCKGKGQGQACQTQTCGQVKCNPCASQTRPCHKTGGGVGASPSSTRPCQKKKGGKKGKCASAVNRTKSEAICQTQPEPHKREPTRTSRKRERPRSGRKKSEDGDDKSEGKKSRDDEGEDEEPKPRSRKRSSDGGGAYEKRMRKSLIPPEQLNFTQPAGSQNTLVDYFLQAEGGVGRVLNLADGKHRYEKKCKARLAKLSDDERAKSEKFFTKIMDTIQVKMPDTNNADIKTYEPQKYMATVMSEINVECDRELRSIQKYHKYIVAVVNMLEQRVRQRESVNPDALIDVETRLLAGFACRTYPLFMRIRDLLMSYSSGGGGKDLQAIDFVKSIKKLILSSFVEVLSIDTAFFASLSTSDPQTQDRYRRLFAARRAHARHAITWAARCCATVLLYYYMTSNFS